MQSLGVPTRTDIALDLLAMFPIEAEIDLRKLILFCQLCRLNSIFRVKTMFLNRLTYFKINPSKQTGFIVEIDKILQKYQLSHILSSDLQDGVFPGKIAWKRMIKANAHATAKTAWHYRLSNPEFYRFTMLHCEFSPHWLWLFSQNN